VVSGQWPEVGRQKAVGRRQKTELKRAEDGRQKSEILYFLFSIFYLLFGTEGNVNNK
jgi:hypothetical protein